MIADAENNRSATHTDPQNRGRRSGKTIFVLVLLILVLMGGAYLRLVGLNWDEDQHMHPDERFLSLVQVAISPVGNGSAGYFDTENSPLNPANRGYGFFVYGTLPIFLVRYAGEWAGQTGYHEITLVGRQISALFDVMTVLLVFAIGTRLYHKWVGLLGSLFYALAVLPIQLSHFMTVDTVTNTFAYLAIFAGVWALMRKPRQWNLPENPDKEESPLPPETEKALISDASLLWLKIRRILNQIAPYLLFGAALGAAAASKINAVVLAMVLPLVEAIRYLKLAPEDRRQAILPILRNLIVGAVISFLVFRLGQPYAFNGPGFLNMGINETWWSSLQSLRAQASGQVDFPPALQWARRPITFSWENMIAWGLGYPLGLFAWIAYLAMGWMIFRKRQFKHLPLWAFTGLYFAWQSISWVRSMRYQMLIYPALALFAGWGLVKLWQSRRPIKLWLIKIKPGLIRAVGIGLTVIIVSSTAAWAFAFTRIYTREHTRVDASRWIYQNIPGALTLQMDTGQGSWQQPLPYRAGDVFDPITPYSMPFFAEADGVISTVKFPLMLDELNSDVVKDVHLSIVSAEAPDVDLGTALVSDTFQSDEQNYQGRSFDFYLDTPAAVSGGQLYYLRLELIQGDASIRLSGVPMLTMVTDDGLNMDVPLSRIQQSVRPGYAYIMNIQVVKTGIINEVTTPFLVDQSGINGEDKSITLNIKLPDQENNPGETGRAVLVGAFLPGEDARGEAYTFVLNEPLQVKKNDVLLISLSTESEGVRLVPQAPSPVHESSWDDALPYPVDGFSPYSADGGIYRGDLNFEMYWNDDPLKLQKFETNLDQADYIFITSNRQWGTTTRVPERYLLTSFYYRHLLGCPSEEDIIWCYSVAEPGMFEGDLGFELVKVVQSNPNLGPIEFNTQFAEEAFTVYDHPKVLIFQKTDSYDPVAVRELLRSVDLTKVVYFTPGEADDYQGPNPDQLYEPRYNLTLPPERLAEQRQGGTWSDLFDLDRLINRSEPLAVVVFYLFVMLLGLLAYPIIRMALPGLADRGYPLARLAGLLLLALVVWLLGSAGVPFNTVTILSVLAGILIVSGVFFFIQRKEIWRDLKDNWAYFLAVEGIALAAFAAFLLVRLGNPDLWHPYKGGEKPMDFSYLNAVLKSTTFPPYDPWFAGGYINYYYYGFVLVGVPIKLLGIVPAVAYNIVLPIWYSLLILGAFSVGWNFYRGIRRSRALADLPGKKKPVLGMAFWVGLATAVGLGVLGNLGTVRLIANGFQRLAAGGLPVDEASFGQQISWTLQGFVQFLKGIPMPFYPGDWYWFPSRVIPGEAITEFPLFTFIYGDLHAHLIAFPITIFAISWSLSVVLSKAKWGQASGKYRWLGLITGFLLGGMVIGALRPTNTWDFYTYVVLAAIALFYSIVRHYQPKWSFRDWPPIVFKIILGLAAAAGLALTAMLLYQPFAYWFGQGYTSVAFWQGDRTPLSSYFTHWGLFLFVIVSWMAWESYHWMKTTPQSALKKLSPFTNWIYTVLILLVIALGILLVMGVSVALVVLPVGLWTVILMLRPGQSDGRRFLLFLIGTSVLLTLVVELTYLPGDIGRMNIVFKFYLQVWIMLALSAGVCFGWLVKSMRYWTTRLAFFWQVVFFILVCSAALFTFMGTSDKIRDRMAPDAPHTLDGMAYMQEATYYDMGLEMQLIEDYNGIRWMQDNVEGSPVILEGQAYEYRWGNRYTIYTGLPGVVGWNWHQRQQRAILRSNIVQERVDSVGIFYATEDRTYIENFLEQYDIQYIVFGQLERVFFPGPGLDKFEAYEGDLWQEVFRDGSTIIYEVID